MTALSFDGVRLTIDYTDRDFLSMVVALRTLITDRFPAITDFNTSSQVEMIIELFSATFDRISFMQDRHAGESNIITARRRQNVINLARSIGYEPGTQRAATGGITATLPDGAISGSLTIPAGTIIKTKEDVPTSFRLTADIVIAPGLTTGTGTIKNSLQFVQDEASDLSVSQTFVLDEAPFLDDGSILVTVSSVDWVEKVTFLDSTSLSQHYLARIDDDDIGSVLFGDGTNGAVPAGAIEITYETGGGVIGNQAAGSITENSEIFTSSLSEQVRVDFTNALATTGGEDRESIEDIRIRAPRNLSAPTRTVTRTDFQVNVEDGVPGVVRAIGFSSDQDITIPENHAYVYVVPTDMPEYSGTTNNVFASVLENAGTLDNGATSVELETVEGLSIGNTVLINDGVTSVTVLITNLSRVSNLIAFAAISIGASIADGAAVTKASTDLVNGDEALTLTDATGLYTGSIVLIDDTVNSVSVLALTVDQTLNTITFDPISGLAAPIATGATVVRTNNGVASPALKDSVETFLTTIEGKPIPLTMDLTVLTALYIPTSIKAKVYVDPDSDFTVVKDLAMAGIRQYFDFSNRKPRDPFDYTIDFGLDIRWSPVVDVIQKIAGVRHVQLFEFNSVGQSTDLPVAEKEIPLLDDSNFDTPYASNGIEFILDV